MEPLFYLKSWALHSCSQFSLSTAPESRGFREPTAASLHLLFASSQMTRWGSDHT